jgi:ABC-type multidrug transport system fused ATPase/permease subunit
VHHGEISHFTENQFQAVEIIVKFVTSIGFLLWISLPLGLISLFCSFLVMAIVILYDRKLISLYQAENNIENHIGSVFFDYLSNITTVFTLRLRELTHTNLYQRMMTIWPFYKKKIILNEVKWFSMLILFSIVQAAILIGYIINSLKTTNTIMLGTVTMIFRYQWELGAAFQRLSGYYSDIVSMNTDMKSIDPILEEIKQSADLSQGVVIPHQWHSIEIKDLIFHHSAENHGQVFDRVSFSIKQGEKIALIGLSGGGKSTLMNLLAGLYTPSHVELKINGVSFDSLEPLQAITTLVPQDPEIFENTIEFNITMGLPVKVDQIYQVIELAGFTKILQMLPDGLKTDIREKGLNLSIGQKQRLSLARGLFAARFSSIILMDEPTSSVDLPTERQILSSIIKAFPNKAIIISLHRLHLLHQFDSVIVLEGGQVVTAGPVSTLLNRPGPLQTLWQSYHSSATSRVRKPDY